MVLCLPVVVARNAPLEYWRWRQGDPFDRGFWDIPVPARRDVVIPDLMLAPMVGFDRANYRLGLWRRLFRPNPGRTLAAALVIGIGYDFGALDTIFPQSHDIPMDARGDRATDDAAWPMEDSHDTQILTSSLARWSTGMPDAIVFADADGLIQVWNAGAARLFGFTEAEALGQPLDIIIPASLRDRHWHGFHETMRTGQTRYGDGQILAVPAIRKDGTRLSVEFTIVPFTDADGHMTGIAAIMRDVTARFEELRDLRKQLRRRAPRNRPWR